MVYSIDSSPLRERFHSAHQLFDIVPQQNPTVSIYLIPTKMRILTWNYQGIGNKKTSKVLQELIAKHKPRLVFLIEIKQVQQKLDMNRIKNGFSKGTYTEPEGRSGGLALWWTDEWDAQLIQKTRNYIDVQVREYSE